MGAGPVGNPAGNMVECRCGWLLRWDDGCLVGRHKMLQRRSNKANRSMHTPFQTIKSQAGGWRFHSKPGVNLGSQIPQPAPTATHCALAGRQALTRRGAHRAPQELPEEPRGGGQPVNHEERRSAAVVGCGAAHAPHARGGGARGWADHGAGPGGRGDAAVVPRGGSGWPLCCRRGCWAGVKGQELERAGARSGS